MSKLSIEFITLNSSNELWDIENIDPDVNNRTIELMTDMNKYVAIQGNDTGDVKIQLGKKKIKLDCFEVMELQVLLKAYDSIHDTDQSFELYEVSEKTKLGG